MRVTIGKKIRTVILIVAFTLIIGVILLGFRFLTEFMRTMVSGHIQTEQALENLDHMARQLSDDADVILAQSTAKTKITARALQQKGFSGWDGGISAFGDGYVVKTEGEQTILPADATIVMASELTEEDLAKLTEELKKAYQEGSIFFDKKNQVLTSMKSEPISDDYAYAEFVPVVDQFNYTDRVMEVLENVKALEKAYDIQIVLRDETEDTILYWPESFAGYAADLETLGVKKADGLKEDISGDASLAGEVFHYVTKTISGKYQAVVLSSMFNGLEQVIPLVIPVCGIVFVCFFVFAFWIFSVFRFVRTERLSLNQQKNYLPKRIRSVSFGFLIISALVVFACSIYGCALIGLYQANADCTRSMETLFERIDASEGQLDSFKKTYDNNLVDELQYTVKLVEQYPELMQKDFLQDVSKVIGAEYLVIYDTEGKEFLTNSNLRGLSLGGPGDSNGTFQKLQNGIASVINEPDKEDPNGFYMASYGVPLSFSDKETYGVLAAYVSPKVRESLKIFTKNELIDVLANGTGLIFTVDPETKDVIYSNEAGIIGRNLIDLGLEEKQLKDHFMDFFRLNNENYYGISQGKDKVLYYVAIPQDDIFFGAAPFAAAAAVPYFFFFLILMFSLLRKYKEENIEWQDVGEEYDGSGETVVLPTGEEKRTVDVSQRWKLLQRFRSKKTPGNSARLLAETLALICIAYGVIYFLVSGKQALAQSSIFGYVIYGE